MFDFIRTHKKIMQILLIILIFPSFVLFGIDGYKQFNEKGEAVAIVDGVEISKDEWEQAHKVEVERMRASMPNVDVSMFDTPVMRYGVLERMIQSRVLESSVKKLHLQVSDQKVAQAISDLEQLASIKKPNGSMDIDQYKQILAAQGMTPEMFEARMRSDLSVRQVVNGVTQSSVTFPSQFQVSLNALAQQREIQVAIFSASDYLDKAQPNEEEIQAFYKTKSDDYKSN
jgi:peptidyl-prolyl cis-trans isomerase D